MTKQDAFIRTYTGGQVFFFEPDKSNIDLLDIYHPLSLLCRFNGNSLYFYSIAQHSVMVADKVFEETGCKSLAFPALMHDGAEAFLSDIPSPFKALFPDFKEVEIRMEEWLSRRFGFEYPLDPIIKKHDLKALSTEMRDLMIVCDNQNLPEPYPEKIIPLDFNESKKLFAQRFHQYRC